MFNRLLEFGHQALVLAFYLCVSALLITLTYVVILLAVRL